MTSNELLGITEYAKVFLPYVLGSGLVATAIGSYLGSRFALRNFKKEKIWINRRDSYIEAIQAMDIMRELANRKAYKYDPNHAGMFTEGEIAEAKLNTYQAIEKLKKLQFLGGIVISEEASREISGLLSDFEYQLRNSKEIRYGEAIGIDDPRVHADMSTKFYRSLEDLVERYMKAFRLLAKNHLKK